MSASTNFEQQQFQLNVRSPSSADLDDFNYIQSSGAISFIDQLLTGSLTQLMCIGQANTGKSHLCYALVAEAKAQQLNCLVVESGLAAQQLIEGDLSMFDLVVFDDVDQIFGAQSEQLLFNFINRAQAQQQQLFFTASSPDLACQLIDLRSRLQQFAQFELPVLQSRAQRLDFIEQFVDKRHLQFSLRLKRLIAEQGPVRSGEIAQLIERVERLLAGRPYKKLSASVMEQIQQLILESGSCADAIPDSR